MCFFWRSRSRRFSEHLVRTWQEQRRSTSHLVFIRDFLKITLAHVLRAAHVKGVWPVLTRYSLSLTVQKRTCIPYRARTCSALSTHGVRTDLCSMSKLCRRLIASFVFKMPPKKPAKKRPCCPSISQ